MQHQSSYLYADAETLVVHPVTYSSSSLPEYKQAEHDKFYYKGEHVILTTKCGRSSLLDNAVSYLKNNFTGLPVIQTYHAVGDSKRPQHKTLLFDDDRIIVTGKKSSGLVGQVYDALSTHFKSSAGSHRPEARQTQKVQPLICTSFARQCDRVEEQLKTESKAITFISDNPSCGQTDSNVKELSAFPPDETVTSAPIPQKEQRKRGANSNSLFSKAITAIHSQSRTVTVSSSTISSTGNACSRSITDCSPAITSDHPAPPTKQSGDASYAFPQSIPANTQSYLTETNNDGLSSCLDLNQSSANDYVANDKNESPCRTSDKDFHSTDAHSIYEPVAHNPFKLVTEVEMAMENASGGPLSHVVSCEAVVKLLSGDILTTDGSSKAANVPIANRRQSFDEMPPDLSSETENYFKTADVYGRELLLELSLSELCSRYPSQLIINSDCEVLIPLQAPEEMFDPALHRMPAISEEVFNAYNTPFNASMRRHMVDPQERRFNSTSDPSCGDSSVYKRTRKLHSAACLEVLYSESAYNCMEPIPENATYCAELDEVFKNRDKVVPGVAFTRRPKESQNDQYVAELLNYYESQGN